MVVTPAWYGNGLKHLLSDTNVATNLKVMLTTSTYVPNQDTHEFLSSVTNEVTGTGYTAGGEALAGVAITYDGATNTVKLDANDVVWAGATITARIAVVYFDTGVAATSPLIVYQQSDVDVSSTAGDWTLTWNSAGIATIVAS